MVRGRESHHRGKREEQRRRKGYDGAAIVSTIVSLLFLLLFVVQAAVASLLRVLQKNLNLFRVRSFHPPLLKGTYLLRLPTLARSHGCIVIVKVPVLLMVK